MTQVVSRPLGRQSMWRRAGVYRPTFRLPRVPRLRIVTAPCLLLAVVIGAHPAKHSSFTRNGVSGPASWTEGTVVLTVYGRAFRQAPVLGSLGQDQSFADVARQVGPIEASMRAANPHIRIRLAIHLIYALATPCSAQDTCVIYLDDTGIDIVNQYILPAQKRGWLVVLDDQLGRSNPTSEMQHLIARGYLRYDNVEVAFDPEFRTLPGQTSPGSPTGSVDASELNRAARMMSHYSARLGLGHRKLMLVHAWNNEMITHRARVSTQVPYVQPVLVMDGIGRPADKVRVYRSLFSGTPGRGASLGGVKLFAQGPYSLPGQVDEPVMPWKVLFGKTPAVDAGGSKYWLSPAPSVVVLT